MAKIFTNNLFAAFLLAAIVLVKSLPTSVLVDTKQSQQPASSESSIHKENVAISTNSPASLEKTPSNANKDQPKLHAQKRGVKQNFYDRDLTNDILVNNNIPNGIWDDTDASILYPDLQELDDYQPYQQQFAAPYRQKPYENLQHILNYDNMYDEVPLALPVKYQYPRYLDERRKRAVNKNIMRLKRESSKLNTADMLALLALLEANERNRYDGDNEQLNSIDYPKAYYGGASTPYGDVQDDSTGGEWWNDWVEPSVQYYGNPYGHVEQSPRHNTKSFAVKRFMVSKKKRSLSAHKPDHYFDASLKSKLATGFDSRYSGSQKF